MRVRAAFSRTPFSMLGEFDVVRFDKSVTHYSFARSKSSTWAALIRGVQPSLSRKSISALWLHETNAAGIKSVIKINVENSFFI